MTTDTIRLVQIIHPNHGRRVALVQEPSLKLLRGTRSVYDLALAAIQSKHEIGTFIRDSLSEETLNYSAIYNGDDDWQLLPSFDHPENSFNCMVSGTGLTHKTSALNRQMMHQAEAGKLTDSMQMYQWGLEGGWPNDDTVGVQPEWFYKGNGAILRAHGQILEVPPYANDGGEEPEIAGVYLVDEAGQPWRIGFTIGNEFSDHVMERKNYLYLATSKLRQCAIGPELIINGSFQNIAGKVTICRNQEELWSKDIKTGENNMAHSLANLEHHHFKYANHRVPLQAHVHFFGADAFSFGDQLQLQAGDVMAVAWEGMGRALHNQLEIATEKETLVQVKALAAKN